MSTGEELQAALSARRDLGPDYDDALAASFLDKVGQEVDRRVDERLRAAPASRQRGPSDGQRLALAIVSLSLGTGATVALAVVGGFNPAFLVIWAGIVIVNIVFNSPRA
ncbi:hypothetical protein OUY22_12600 [Nonomuraea sp. MCN248]|uniref:DUF3040 domain-containing protein n=1 Tax=Nonomuraea corallina TaxID=2989783 RepID=A0ABT4SBE4_9ACTN|nr:hypothetical protein [Nonomuraea corallina]MDA0634256.1 hypothetical protein [Nonomuraea corallina]